LLLANTISFASVIHHTGKRIIYTKSKLLIKNSKMKINKYICLFTSVKFRSFYNLQEIV
jgi:hypothetical protein